MDGLFNRKELALRWGCSTRKIDRHRKRGELPWLDLTVKLGKRPSVRFKMEDILEFEEKCKMKTIIKGKK